VRAVERAISVATMSTPLRISLRVLGFALLASCVVIVVAMFVPGPGQIANWMGSSCAHETNGPGEQCTIFDVLGFLEAVPFVFVAGLVLMAVTRRPGSGPVTINLAGRRP
jgi:hypothetical protein